MNSDLAADFEIAVTGAPALVGTTKQPALVGKGENYEIFAVRWPAVRDVHGEGLLLVPKGEKVADIVAIPDADQTPEQICGLADGVPPESQFARRLAEFMGAVRNPEILADCVSVSRDVMAGDFYRALMRCRRIIAYEDERLGNAGDVDTGLSTRERAG